MISESGDVAIPLRLNARYRGFRRSRLRAERSNRGRYVPANGACRDGGADVPSISEVKADNAEPCKTMVMCYEYEVTE